MSATLTIRIDKPGNRSCPGRRCEFIRIINHLRANKFATTSVTQPIEILYSRPYAEHPAEGAIKLLFRPTRAVNCAS